MAPPKKEQGRGRKKIKSIESSEDEEYRRKRDRNNQAVKRSRVKSRMRTQETLERVQQLKRENDQLEEKIKLLSKELSFLKDLFIAHTESCDEIAIMLNSSRPFWYSELDNLLSDAGPSGTPLISDGSDAQASKQGGQMVSFPNQFKDFIDPLHP